jgi:hypothetical protein
MSHHITDEKLFQSWEATPEPDIGQPSETIIFGESGDGYYVANEECVKNELITYDGPLMEVSQ